MRLKESSPLKIDLVCREDSCWYIDSGNVITILRDDKHFLFREVERWKSIHFSSSYFNTAMMEINDIAVNNFSTLSANLNYR